MSFIQLTNSFSRPELDMLICHVVRRKSVMQAAFNNLKHDQFLPDVEMIYKLVWVVAREFFEMHKTPIPEPAMRASIDKKREDNPEYFGGDILASVLATVELIYGVEEHDLIDSYGIELLKRFLGERKIGVQLIRAAQTGALERKHLWEIIDTANKIDSLTSLPTVFPFSTNTGPLIGIKPREPTGITFLDVMMNGGPRKGELYGFLAPSAGGKTTLANQMAISYALSGKHVMFFTYEQPPDNEYMVPVYACVAQADRRKFEKIMKWNGDMSFLSEQERERFERLSKIINEQLHYKDMTRGACTGAEQIKILVEQEQNELGIKVDAVIIDWFLPMATRSYDTIELGYGKRKDLRSHMQEQVDRLKIICVELDVWGWLTHQLNLTEGSKKNKVLEFSEAAELKSFAWWMNGCFVLSKMDDDGMAPLNFSKARSAKSNKIVIKLLGEIATFVEATNMVFDSRQKRFVERGTENNIPKANAESRRDRDRTDYEGNVGAVRT
jgi:RecA/RadA recombinase